MVAMSQKISSFHQLFSTIETQQTPSLVWYSHPGERVELSGRVLMNWVSKTSNLLDEELDFSDSPKASVLFGPHWRSVAIICAVLNAGGCIDFETAEDSSVVFTDSTDESASLIAVGENEYVVAVDRGALSPRFMGKLPQDAVDYCAEVRSFGDVYFPLSTASGQLPAWHGATHQQALEAVQLEAQDFVSRDEHAFIVPVQKKWSTDYLASLLSVIASGKTAVILDPTISWAQERLSRIMDDEKATKI